MKKYLRPEPILSYVIVMRNQKIGQKPLTDEQKSYVYHAEMKIGNQRFMFSDIIEFEICHGNSLFVVITFDTKAEVQAVYQALLPGSTVLGFRKIITTRELAKPQAIPARDSRPAYIYYPGMALVPIHSTTYSSCTANLIDKYGIRWGLMTEQTER